MRSIDLNGKFVEEITSLGAPFSSLDYPRLLFASIFLSCLLSFSAVFALGASSSALLLSSFLLVAPPLLLYAFLSYFESKKQRAIEDELPSLLFQLASYPEGTPFEKMLLDAASGPGVLARELSIASSAIPAGSSVPQALSILEERNSSRLLRRSLHILRSCYSSGAPLSRPLKDIAESIFDLQSIAKEGAAAQAMQKYTLLIGGAVLVPCILALLLGMVSSFDYSSLSLTGSSSAELLPAIVLSAQVYLAAFAAVSSLFLGLQEGNIKKAVIYFSFVAPSSLLLFDAASKARLF